MKLVVMTVLSLTALSVVAMSNSPSAPYAGQQHRDIKALSETEVADLLAGKGMGYAKSAELNGYPGPLHVLELDSQLTLTPEQRQRTKTIFDAMQSKAKKLGAQLVEEEKRLDQMFARKQASSAAISATLTRIARLQADLRLSHLEAHLAQTAVLTPVQVAAYQQARGYRGASHTSGTHGGHKH